MLPFIGMDMGHGHNTARCSKSRGGKAVDRGADYLPIVSSYHLYSIDADWVTFSIYMLTFPLSRAHHEILAGTVKCCILYTMPLSLSPASMMQPPPLAPKQ
jgi:hypothetical protein